MREGRSTLLSHLLAPPHVMRRRLGSFYAPGGSCRFGLERPHTARYPPCTSKVMADPPPQQQRSAAGGVGTPPLAAGMSLVVQGGYSEQSAAAHTCAERCAVRQTGTRGFAFGVCECRTYLVDTPQGCDM